MIRIRKYKDADFNPVQRLVRDVFTKFITPDASVEGVLWWTNYHTLRRENRENIRKRFQVCPIRYVALDNDKVIGTVMGTPAELVRIFVRESHWRRGIGRRLLDRFESRCIAMGSRRYRIAAALCSVPFYRKLGCRKTTGVRELHGLPVQPMRKVIAGHE